MALHSVLLVALLLVVSLIGSSSSLGRNPIGGVSFGGSHTEGSGALGGEPFGGNEPFATSSSLGGEIFTGQLPQRSDFAIGSHNDKWNSAGPSDRGNGLYGSSSSLGIGGGDIWGSESGRGMSGGGSRTPGVIGGSNSSLGSIGPGDGALAPGGSYNANSGSSALASMLGINLPTGTGSLRESSSLWSGPSPSPAPTASLHAGTAPGVIGSASYRAPGGGIAVEGGSSMSSGVGLRSSGSMPSSSGNSDIALLQSLLPGVHITRGNAKQPAAPGTSVGGWDPMASAPMGQVGNSGGGFGLGVPPQGETWGGSSGRVADQGGSRQQQQSQSGIW